MADPSVIRGRDAYWYVYATNTLLLEGSSEVQWLPIIRSRDLVTWEHVADVFDDENWPSWLGPQSRLWDPCIEYWGGIYRLYFTGVDVPDHELPNRAIGVATGPTPMGPWTDSGEVLLGPAWYTPLPDERSFQWIIGPHVMATLEGERYLYYGGYRGGMWAIRLTDDGTGTIGEPTRLAGEMHQEGPYVVYRNGYYYHFASSDQCCNGPVSGYAGYVARSTSPLGPFVDRHGVPIHDLRPGGTPTLSATGNSWVGLGRPRITTDLSGQDWFVYNAIDRHHPYLRGSFEGQPRTQARRALLIDRLDWVDGWPTLRGGDGPSDQPVAAPETAGLVADAFETGGEIGHQWEPDRAGWEVEHEPAGGFVRADAGGGTRLLFARRAVLPDVRIRAAVRLPDGGASGGAAGFVLSARGTAGEARVYLDAAERAVVVEAETPREGDPVQVVEPLPEPFAFDSWHDLAIEVRSRALRVEVTDAALGDPVAIAETTLPDGLVAGRFALLARDAIADFDDVTAARLYRPHTEVVPDPAVGTVDEDYSDEFTGNELGPAWSWVRDAVAEVNDGALEYPVVPGNLNQWPLGPNVPPLVVCDAPDGEEWTLETKAWLDLGVDPLYGHPRASLVIYTNDDDYLRIFSGGHTDARFTRLNRKMPYVDEVADTVLNGSSWTGPPGELSTLLRIQYSMDPESGERHFRGASSPDGEQWTWGAVYTTPADQEFRVGLMTDGASDQDPPFVARFDYVRLYRP